MVIKTGKQLLFPTKAIKKTLININIKRRI